MIELEKSIFEKYPLRSVPDIIRYHYKLLPLPLKPAPPGKNLTGSGIFSGNELYREQT